MADRAGAGGAGGGAEVNRESLSRLASLPQVGLLPQKGARQGGYTLVEVLVAFVILALALTLLLGTLSGAARQVKWSEEAGRAALHAQSLLAGVGVAQSLAPGRRSGTFEDGQYRWTLEIAPYEDPLLPPPELGDPAAPRLMQLSLQVRWGDGEDPRRLLQLRSLRYERPDPLDPFAGGAP